MLETIGSYMLIIPLIVIAIVGMSILLYGIGVGVKKDYGYKGVAVFLGILTYIIVAFWLLTQ